MTRRFQGMSVLLLACVPVVADEAAKTPLPTMEMVARFHDGTTIRKATLQESITIQTRYGKLDVPVADVRRIEFGLHIPEETAQKIEAAVRNLGSDKFPEREAASKELVGLGFRAYGAVQAAAKSKDKEVATRAAAVLDKIRAAAPEDLLRLKPHDVIHTRDCVLSGKILSPGLKAKTANFGEMHFKIADLNSLQSMAKAEAEVSVAAAEAGPALKWHDTGLLVESDMDLIIRAAGQIEFTPPQGLPNGAAALLSGPEGTSSRGTNGYLVGALLGKVGDRGDIFMIGPRFEGKAIADGRLQLLVVPSQGGVAPSGAYKVNVSLGFDLAPGLKRMEPTSPSRDGPPSGYSKKKGGFSKN